MLELLYEYKCALPVSLPPFLENLQAGYIISTGIMNIQQEQVEEIRDFCCLIPPTPGRTGGWPLRRKVFIERKLRKNILDELQI